MGDLEERLDKKKKKKKCKKAKQTNTKLGQKDVMLQKEEEGNEKNNCQASMKKKRKREKGNNVDAGKALQIGKDKLAQAEGEMKKNKPPVKKRKSEGKNNASVRKLDQIVAEAIAGSDEQTGKTKKSKKKKMKDKHMSKEGENLLKKSEEADDDEVYWISSGDEDCSKGMKKWLTEYHQSRPGLKVLQQRIDEFIIAHEEKLEEEKKEREARAAEEGWTVVVSQKGRKKTTDSESGISVGFVAPAVAEDQLAKKKQKEVGLNFYRFQRREAQRNEILALQSKFEQDKKRIQQLRAARKFRPF